MQKQAPFNKTVALTSNSFRLLDDAECVPSFKTYTVTRRYTLGVTVGIQYNDQEFVVRSTTPLEILPRVRRDAPALTQTDEEEDAEPLPVYSPREPEREFAPDYEEIFNTLSRIPSSGESVLSRVESSSSSLFSRGSGVSTVASTPGVEVEQMRFERVV